MAKKYIGENAIAFLVALLKGELTKKVDNSDSRLTDARDPKQHGFTHNSSGTDPIDPHGIGAVDLTDIVDRLDVADATKVLSANKGKELLDMISNINVDNDIGAYMELYKGRKGGICPLGEDTLIPSQYLPSFVDDVIEGYLVETKNESGTVIDQRLYKDEEKTEQVTPEKGKIYIDIDTGNSYRWSGSLYVLITSSDMVELDNTDIQGIWDTIMNPFGSDTIITFMINNETYQAAETMTWADWTLSVYNTKNFTINGTDSTVRVIIDGVEYKVHNINITDNIVAEANYTLDTVS